MKLPVAVLALLTLVSVSLSATSTVEISGGTPPPATRYGTLGEGRPVVVGTFADSFDPMSDIRKYRLDDANNFSPEFYFQMVGAGDFTPIGETQTTGTGQFSGLFLAPELEGKQLWLVVWDGPSKSSAESALVTSLGNANWVVGQSGTHNRIDLNEGNWAIFGEMIDGRLHMHGLPMPEPPPITLATCGIVLLIASKFVFRRR